MKKDNYIRLALAFCVFFIVYIFGVRPILTRQFYLDDYKTGDWANGKLTHEEGKYDVIVAGDEPDGIAAAVCAARTGARVLLLSETSEIGGSVVLGLDNEFIRIYGDGGELINKGFFWEINNAMDKDYSIDKYKSVIQKIVKEQKNLEVIYNAGDMLPVLDGDTVTGVKFKDNGSLRTIYSKRVIDSTWDGKILSACSVPFFYGSEDINMKKTYLPVRLNFEMEGVNYNDYKKVINTYGEKFYTIIAKYKPLNINVKINNFSVSDNGNNKVIVKGIEFSKLDAGDGASLKGAYADGTKEAINFSNFLSSKLEIFAKSKFSRAADRLIIPELKHFSGKYLLTVSDILENKDFEDKIAIGGTPVYGKKFSDDGKDYIIGNPKQYGIPIGCIIPEKVNNLLMTGNKISYSSLASSSANKIPVNIAVGQSAGIAAVYSITEEINTSELISKQNKESIDMLHNLFNHQGENLPKIKFQNENSSSWCYTSIKELTSLGLISGGVTNDYKLERQANDEDLAYIILNGVYRLSPQKYNFDFDTRVRPFIKKDKLTKDTVARMLLLLHGKDLNGGNFYERACSLGYVDELAQIRLRNTEILTMDQIYHLGAYNIKLYTGKKIIE